MGTISFPGLGIEAFEVNKVAFTIFGHDIAWYGVLITCGMILALVCGLRLAKIEKISTDDLVDLAFCVIIFGVLGARAYYVIFDWGAGGQYLVTDRGFWGNIFGTLYNCIAMWEGGLAIYGGVIAGMLAGVVFARKKKIPILKIFDLMAPCVLIGQIIGRWGNFINIEAFGSVTSLPWRMCSPSVAAYLGINKLVDTETYAKILDGTLGVHPTFFYESMWNLCALIIILSLYKKKKIDGQMCSIYFIWYGLGRMLIEGLRTDSLMLGSIRISQLIGLVSLISGIVLIVIRTKMWRATVLCADCEAETGDAPDAALSENTDSQPAEEKNIAENTTENDNENITDSTEE